MKRITAVILLSLLSQSAPARDQFTICEGDGAGGHARLEFRFKSPGQYEALTMTYGGRDVIDTPLSVFNHMGLILFRGSGGIEFNAFEDSDEFFVTVPAFGGKFKTTEGQCKIAGAKNLPARQVTAEGRLGNGIFGDCSSPDEIGYLSLAKIRALADAERQCSPLQIRQISEFEVSTACEEGFKTAVVKATFECEPIAK